MASADGARTSMGLGKLPAKDPSRKLGSLVVNLGGPQPTIDQLPRFKPYLARLTSWFDVVVFDPRGMGHSSGVSCPAAPDGGRVRRALDERTWNAFSQENQAWGIKCDSAAGPLAGHVDSWQTAHDMDAIRRARGESKLRYFGNSYGTVYGQAYAQLLPDKVRGMYLDSVYDHTERSLTRFARPQAVLAEQNFTRFGAWCAAERSCALYGENPLAVWDRLVATAAAHPLPASGARTVTADELRANTYPAPELYRELAKGLTAARAGDATYFAGSTNPDPPDTTIANLVMCADFPATVDYREMTGVDRRLQQAAPRIGWLMGRSRVGRCLGLPKGEVFPPHRIHPVGLAPYCSSTEFRTRPHRPHSVNPLPRNYPARSGSARIPVIRYSRETVDA